jgi:hypothetical protein
VTQEERELLLLLANLWLEKNYDSGFYNAVLELASKIKN